MSHLTTDHASLSNAGTDPCRPGFRPTWRTLLAPRGWGRGGGGIACSACLCNLLPCDTRYWAEDPSFVRSASTGVFYLICIRATYDRRDTITSSSRAARATTRVTEREGQRTEASTKLDRAWDSLTHVTKAVEDRNHDHKYK